MNVLAFDLGASSGRAIIGQFDGSKLSMKEVHRFINGTVKIQNHLYWDIPRFFEEMQAGLKEAMNSMPIESFGIDSWGVDGAFIGRNNTLLGNPYGYREFSVENMNECIDAVGAEKLYDITGIQFLPFNTIFQFYRHIKENNPLIDAAENFLFIPDYLRFLFTGKMNTEYTIASTGQMLDAKTYDWSKELIKPLNIPENLLGEIVHPGTVCGKVEGTDVKAIAVAGHDTGSAVLSVPVTEESDDWAWMSSGTWSIIGIESPTPIISEEGRAENFSNEGGAFKTIRFLKNIMGLWISQECRRIWASYGKQYSYDTLDEMVQNAYPNGPTIELNDNRFMAPENMILEIQDACEETGQTVPESPGEIMRCVLESLAKEYAKVLKTLGKLTGKNFKKLHVVGGGTNNKRLNQMTADSCGIPVIAGPVEGTAIGNILMQLIANGELANISEARQLVKDSFPTTTYEPK